MTIKKQEETMQILAPVFVCTDGTRFRPDFVGTTIDGAIERARGAALNHQRQLDQQREIGEAVARLFGSNADAVMGVLWSDEMRYFERRLEVLRTLDQMIHVRNRT